MTASKPVLVTAVVFCALVLPRSAIGETSATPTPIKLIAPGTTIGDEAPAPWTHLIVKSQPRVTAGDVEKVSSSQVRLAGLYFMATFARVEHGASPAAT